MKTNQVIIFILGLFLLIQITQSLDPIYQKLIWLFFLATILAVTFLNHQNKAHE